MNKTEIDLGVSIVPCTRWFRAHSIDRSLVLLSCMNKRPASFEPRIASLLDLKDALKEFYQEIESSISVVDK